jgi:hypothetical protein
MSRAYYSYIEVGPTNKQTGKIIEENSGDITLCGGESEEDFVERVTKEIWRLEGKFIPVSIEMTYMDDLPYERYEMNEDEYEELMNS